MDYSTTSINTNIPAVPYGTTATTSALGQKTVYQTDGAGLYVGTAIASEDPLTEGSYLMPAGCVETAPPTTTTGEVAVWADDAWTTVADHRGETWYLNGVATVVTTVGDPTTSGYTQTVPLSVQQATKVAAINAKAEALISAGAPYTVSGTTYHIALDDGSRADLTAMASTAIAAAAGSVSWPESYSTGWIATNNDRIPLATAADGLALAASVGDYYASIVQQRRTLKDAVLAAADETALDAIDITTGWPS